MWKRLLENKKYVVKIGELCENVRLSSEDWNQIEILCESLLPSKNATILLQKKGITVIDLYKIWRDNYLQTKKIGM